ncbi:WD40 repeat domain-containing protein [Streptomyces sp. NPDC093065]|uniref:WD40 repeat domain-containing protein n=1 Tax=Streptomyces sp. NPDC093065 TaxID=3366021 RepID=UPI00382788BC
MTFAEDMHTLLADELADSDAETALYGAVIGTPLLLEFVRALIAARDVASLRALCHGTVELHELTERYGTVAGALPTPADAPFSGCGPVTGAVRAVAALGLVLVDEEERVEEHLGIALTWLAHTRAVVGAPWPAGRAAPKCAHEDRLSSVVRALGTDPHGTAVIVWLLGLQEAAPKKGATAAVDVLLDQGDRGIRATLRCTSLRRLPDALVPDPASMLLFSADPRFRSGLETAWRTAWTDRRRDGRSGRHRRIGAVLWSLRDADGPVDHVQDVSLTAAFTLLVDEIRRRNRRVLGPFTWWRLGGSTAVVGGVDDDGRMVQVTGYRNKFGTAAGLDRVLVPAGDLEQARDLARGLQTKVIGVRTWGDAARRSRVPNRGARWRFVLVCLAVLLAGSGTGGAIWNHQRQIQALRDTAAEVRDEAYEISGNGDPGRGLLLAMASDDIAGRAGDKTDVLDSMARDSSSLRRILRPEEGRFEDLALSETGEWAALSTTTGAVQILSGLTGDTKWRQKGGGAELPTPGVYVSALALSPAGQWAAFASTDLRLTVLERKDGKWSVTARPTLPVPSHPGPLHTESNAIDHLAFTADGQRVVAYSDKVGLFVWDVEHPDSAPKRCEEGGDSRALSVTDEEALLTTDGEVVRIDLTTCARSVVLTAPEGVQLHGAVQYTESDTDNGVVAAATRDAQVFTLRSDGSESVLSNRGPYRNVSITSSRDGVHLSATTESATLGWKVDKRTQEFGHANAGPSQMSKGIMLRHYGAVAELHDDRHSPATTAWAPCVCGLASVAWAGDALVLRSGRSVHVLPGAAGMAPSVFSDPDTAQRLPMPLGATAHELATSKDGPWAAVLYGSEGGDDRRLAVWDVETQRRTPVRLPEGPGPRHAAIVGRDLYLGYRSGDVRRVRFTDGAWRSADSRRLAAPVVALGGGGGDAGTTDRLYAVVSKGSDAPPSVVGLSTPGLSVTGTRRLQGATSIAKVEVMRDGEVVVGSGAGTITFLTRELDVRGRTVDGDLQFVQDLTEVPNRAQVLVSGKAHSIVLDRRSLDPQEAWKHGAPFLSSDVPADGKVLATYSFATLDASLWTLEDSDLRAQVCRAVGRDLSREEWRQYVGTDLSYRPVCRN